MKRKNLCYNTQNINLTIMNIINDNHIYMNSHVCIICSIEQAPPFGTKHLELVSQKVSNEKDKIKVMKKKVFFFVCSYVPRPIFSFVVKLCCSYEIEKTM